MNFLKLVTLVQRKIEKGDTVDKIADDLLEDQEIIEKIYNLIRKYPDKDEKKFVIFDIRIKPVTGWLIQLPKEYIK